MVTREDILQLATAFRKEKPSWREGQAVFNAAHTLHPAAANAYRGSRVDPFHNDSLINSFLEVVELYG